LSYYETVVKQPDKSLLPLNTLLNADSLAYGIDSFTVGVLFDGPVQVVYKPKRNPIEYHAIFQDMSFLHRLVP
jgi:hypothetical protein